MTQLTQTVKTVSEQETTQGERQKQNPISRERGRNGGVRDFAYTWRAAGNTKHIDIVTAYVISCGRRRNANCR